VVRGLADLDRRTIFAGVLEAHVAKDQIAGPVIREERRLAIVATVLEREAVAL
jgi:hypothetical protein